MKKIILILLMVVVSVCFVGCAEKIDYYETSKEIQAELNNYYLEVIQPELEKKAQEITGFDDTSIVEYRFISKLLGDWDEENKWYGSDWNGESSITINLQCAFCSGIVDNLFDDSFIFGDESKIIELEQIKEILYNFESELDSLIFSYSFTYGEKNDKVVKLLINVESVTSSETVEGFGYYPTYSKNYGIINGKDIDDDGHYVLLTDYGTPSDDGYGLQLRPDGQLIIHSEENEIPLYYNYNYDIYLSNKYEDDDSTIYSEPKQQAKHWSDLSDEEKEWYERNYGNGQYEDINEAIEEYIDSLN